jgi:hypothetical protein
MRNINGENPAYGSTSSFVWIQKARPFGVCGIVWGHKKVPSCFLATPSPDFAVLVPLSLLQTFHPFSPFL